MRTILWIGLLMIQQMACRNIIQGNDELQLKKRSLTPFTNVDVSDRIRLILEIDKKGPILSKFEVATDSNLHAILKTEVSDNTLFASLSVDDKVKSNLGFGISGQINGIEKARIGEYSSVYLKGSSENFELTTGMKAVFDGQDLTVKTARVDAEYGGNISICVTEGIFGTIGRHASLKVYCGGDTSGLEVIKGGILKEMPAH